MLKCLWMCICWSLSFCLIVNWMSDQSNPDLWRCPLVVWSFISRSAHLKTAEQNVKIKIESIHISPAVPSKSSKEIRVRLEIGSTAAHASCVPADGAQTWMRSRLAVTMHARPQTAQPWRRLCTMRTGWAIVKSAELSPPSLMGCVTFCFCFRSSGKRGLVDSPAEAHRDALPPCPRRPSSVHGASDFQVSDWH